MQIRCDARQKQYESTSPYKEIRNTNFSFFALEKTNGLCRHYASSLTVSRRVREVQRAHDGQSGATSVCSFPNRRKKKKYVYVLFRGEGCWYRNFLINEKRVVRNVSKFVNRVN